MQPPLWAWRHVRSFTQRTFVSYVQVRRPVGERGSPSKMKTMRVRFGNSTYSLRYSSKTAPLSDSRSVSSFIYRPRLGNSSCRRDRHEWCLVPRVTSAPCILKRKRYPSHACCAAQLQRAVLHKPVREMYCTFIKLYFTNACQVRKINEECRDKKTEVDSCYVLWPLLLP